MIFPGQASQYEGMGKKLYQDLKIVKDTFDEACDVLNFDLRKICFDGEPEELIKTENTQLALLTLCMAIFRIYMDQINIEPACVVGHSLGEITALCSTGAISFPDALRLVRKRGLLMKEAIPFGEGAMCAISGMDRKIVEMECNNLSVSNDVLVISNYNSKEQVVISGKKESVVKMGKRLESIGARTVLLSVSAPFHSPYMESVAEKFREELLSYKFFELKWPVISNVTAKPYYYKENIINNLTTQITSPVMWEDSMKYLQVQGVNVAVELGPKSVLKGLMKRNAPNIQTFSYDIEGDWQALEELINANKHSLYKRKSIANNIVTMCLANAVCTKNNNWNKEEYEKGVITPYEEMKAMQDEIDKTGLMPTVEQGRRALELLQLIFESKQVDSNEQTDRINNIFDQTGTRDIYYNFNMK